MSIDVYYQPIDVNVVRVSIFPFVRGLGELTHLESQCEQPEEAIAILTPLRNAYAARTTGTD